MRKIYLFTVLPIFLLLACGSDYDGSKKLQYPGSVTVRAKNTLDLTRTDEVVAIPLSLVKSKATDFNPRAMVLISRGKDIALQLDDADGDGSPDRILADLDLKGHETRKLELRYTPVGIMERVYPQRTQAELSIKFGGKWQKHKYFGGTFHNIDVLRVPPEHTDHSEYIRYEGPGWESDKVGYRFYLDWRNAIDVYGKKTHELVLQNVGQDGFESYHHMSDWGMDILKVGDALGVGTIAWWDGEKANRVAVTDSVRCRIATVGPLLSRIRTDYFNWRIGADSLDLHSELCICAGSRMTRHALTFSGNPSNLCTGLVKLSDTELIPPPADGKYTWLATWGLQSLNNDHLGMAVLYPRQDFILQTQDSHSHVVVLKPEGNRLVYYFLAAWELEPGGVTSKEAFTASLNEAVAKLNHPIIIE